MKTFSLRLLVLCTVIVAHSAHAAFASTSWKLEDRDRMLSESKCKTSLKRTNNFVKYFPPVYSQQTLALYNRHESIRAYDLMADLYYYGCAKAGLQPDKVEAAKWYLFVANLHVPEAQFKLGKMMVDGDGIPKDEAAGMEWIVSAALEQDSNARDYLEQRGIEAPIVSGLNTYERIVDYNRQIAKQQRAEFLSDLGVFVLEVVTLAAVTYAVVNTNHAPSYPSQTRPVATNSPTIYRYRPVYCTSNIRATGYSNVVTGTVTTFCN